MLSIMREAVCDGFEVVLIDGVEESVCSWYLKV